MPSGGKGGIKEREGSISRRGEGRYQGEGRGYQGEGRGDIKG